MQDSGETAVLHMEKVVEILNTIVLNAAE